MTKEVVEQNLSPMLENALGSIEVGIEDFELKPSARVASAVRNLHAGVLFLCKEKLRRMSPSGSGDMLIHAVFEPVVEGGTVVIRGRGRITVGTDDIIKRFDSLGLTLNFKDVRRLGDIRNNIEHRAPAHSVAVMREAIAATTAVVVQLLKEHLELTPADVLSDRTWQRMLKEAATHRAMRKSCVRSIDGLDGALAMVKQALKDEAVCPVCDSTLLEAHNPYPSDFRCQDCGEPLSAEHIVVAALNAAYGVTDHERTKDGESPAIEKCPTCNEDAFILEEDCCGLCGQGRPYERCDRCGNPLLRRRSGSDPIAAVSVIHSGLRGGETGPHSGAGSKRRPPKAVLCLGGQILSVMQGARAPRHFRRGRGTLASGARS